MFLPDFPLDVDLPLPGLGAAEDILVKEAAAIGTSSICGQPKFMKDKWDGSLFASFNWHYGCCSNLSTIVMIVSISSG